MTVTKSGEDIVLSWTGSGTAYDGARATDAPFTNATTQFIASTGTSYTYVGGLSNARPLEFFDVTDETESNHGGRWNGGVLPPLPPVIDTGNPSTNIGSLFIGSTGIIAGSGFSSIPEVNTVCFEGGVCTQATSSNSNQIQFVTPPGAYSGPVTITIGSQTSDPAPAVVALDDPATWSIIRDLTFSRQDHSYWFSGNLSGSGVASRFRLYFDSMTKQWNHEDRGGALGVTTGGCSAQTSPTGRIFCGGRFSLGEIHTRIVDTSPPSDLAECMVFTAASSGASIATPSSAVDPNPDGLRTNVAYFSTFEGDIRPSRIRKVAHDCSSVLDDNYGNFDTHHGAKNSGMVVDPRNGDLYFSDDGEIWRITMAENVSVVRTDLPTGTKLVGLSLEGTGDPGTLLLITGGVYQALALDNVNAEPITVATVTGVTAANFGAQVSGGPWIDSNINRTVTVYLKGTSLVLADHPLITVTDRGPFQVRISSPKKAEEEQLPPGQSTVRPSEYGNPDYSRAIAKLQYRDGMARNTCAKVGDPGRGAPQYDPDPATPGNCNKPRSSAAAICDNIHDIVVAGPGSFVDTGGLVSCKMCGDAQNPCSWEFRITNRYPGDNYKVYFAFDEFAEQFAATSDVYTAWKHVHIERERMCNVGAILFQDYGAINPPDQCGGAGQPSCCGPVPPATPCDQIVVYEEPGGGSPISVGQSIVVFDEVNPYETAGYTREVQGLAPIGNGRITVTLDGTLPKSYFASTEHMPGMTPHVPDFLNLHSGGVCVPSEGFVEADVSDLRQAYDLAFVANHIPVYGVDGTGAVPRLWPEFFDVGPTSTRRCAPRRFSRVWYSKFEDAGAILGCPDPPADPALENNILHLIPAFDTVSADNPAGFSAFESGFSFIFDVQILQDCAARSTCTATDQDAMRRWTVTHEKGHQFQVNKCVPAADGHDTRKAWCGAPGGACVIPPAPDQNCVMVAGTSGQDNLGPGTGHACRRDRSFLHGGPCRGRPDVCDAA